MGLFCTPDTVDVVQLVRTSDCGSEGRGFESHLPPKQKRLTRRNARTALFFKFPFWVRVTDPRQQYYFYLYQSISLFQLLSSISCILYKPQMKVKQAQSGQHIRKQVPVPDRLLHMSADLSDSSLHRNMS